MQNTKRNLNLKLIRNTVDSVNGTQEKRRKKQQRKQFFSHVVRCLRFFMVHFLSTSQRVKKREHNERSGRREKEWKNDQIEEINRRNATSDGCVVGVSQDESKRKMTDMIRIRRAKSVEDWKRAREKERSEANDTETNEIIRNDWIEMKWKNETISPTWEWASDWVWGVKMVMVSVVKWSGGSHALSKCVINVIDYLDWGYLF